MTCHMHLSTSNDNNSPHKLSFQNTMRAGDQKLRYELVWPLHHDANTVAASVGEKAHPRPGIK